LIETSVVRVQEHFERIRPGPRQLAARFYELLFASHPHLRSLFPYDLTALHDHFEATLTRVIQNLGRVTAVDADLRDLGVRHLAYGAQPQHYLIVRDVLVATIADISAGDWDATLESDWRLAVNMIIVPMLRGAAVETASVAERIAAEDVVDGMQPRE
jgi:eukaryotic-like serine/threonine-protein kinase